MNMRKSILAVSLSFLVVIAQAGCGSGGGSTPSAGSPASGSSGAGTGAGTTSTGSTPTDGGVTTVGTTSTGDTTSAGGTTSAGVARVFWNTPQVGASGFKVYYGAAPKTYSNFVDAGVAPGYTFTLPPGTYYFAVTAYDSSGNESLYSSEVSKTIY